MGDSLTNESFNHFINGCLRHDKFSQKELYKRFYSFSKAICDRYAENEGESVRMLNNSFIKIFQCLKHYRYAIPFNCWIKEIIIKELVEMAEIKCLDYNREIFSEISPEGNNGQDYESLITMLQLLPKQNRYVFNLHVIDGYDIQAIAIWLKIDETSVELFLRGARYNLRHMDCAGK